jgi:hypothetical protein
MRRKRLREVLLGLDGAQCRAQLCCLAFSGVELCLSVFKRNAPTSKERHNPVSLEGFLTEGLLQPVLLLNDAVGLAPSLAQLLSGFSQRLFRVQNECSAMLPDKVF